MAYSDIQRLRQQQIFQPIQDMSQMGMDYGMGMGGGMNYAPSPIPAMPPSLEDYGPPKPSPLEQIGQQPSTGPASPNVGVAPTQIDPTKTPVGASPLANQGQSIEDYIAAINKGYTPEFTDRDRLRRLMDTVPERQPPSLARALVAGGLSIKAEDPIKTSEAVMQAPYLRDMASWTAKAEPFYKTAQLENQQNINERTLMANAVTAKTSADRLAEQARQADLKNEQALGRNRINMIKAQMGQGWKMDARNGTTVKAINSATGEVKDTGIPTRWMDEADKIDAEGEWNVRAAEARGAAAVRTAQAGAVAGNRDIVVINGETYQRNPDRSLTPVEGAPSGMPTRLGTPPRATGAKTSTLESNRVINKNLKDAWQSDPTTKEFIKETKEGELYDFQPRPVLGANKKWYGGGQITQEDVDRYDEFRKSMDPSYVPPKTGGIGPGATKEKPPTQGLGPTPAATEKWTPRGDYVPKPVPKGKEETLSGVVSDITGAMTAKPAHGDPGVYARQGTPQAPPTPPGRIAVYDAQGNLKGHIPDTPEQRAAAAAQGLNPR